MGCLPLMSSASRKVIGLMNLRSPYYSILWREHKLVGLLCIVYTNHERNAFRHIHLWGWFMPYLFATNNQNVSWSLPQPSPNSCYLWWVLHIMRACSLRLLKSLVLSRKLPAMFIHCMIQYLMNHWCHSQQAFPVHHYAQFIEIFFLTPERKHD